MIYFETKGTVDGIGLYTKKYKTNNYVLWTQ